MGRVRRELTRCQRVTGEKLNFGQTLAALLLLWPPSSHRWISHLTTKTPKHDKTVKSNMTSMKNPLLYTLVHSQTSHPFVPSHHLLRISQIGNLSFFTTEEQIHDTFSKCANPEDGGGVKRIIMGLDRNTRYATLCWK
jgi:hypothetical protein